MVDQRPTLGMTSGMGPRRMPPPTPRGRTPGDPDFDIILQAVGGDPEAAQSAMRLKSAGYGWDAIDKQLRAEGKKGFDKAYLPQMRSTPKPARKPAQEDLLPADILQDPSYERMRKGGFAYEQTRDAILDAREPGDISGAPPAYEEQFDPIGMMTSAGEAAASVSGWPHHMAQFIGAMGREAGPRSREVASVPFGPGMSGPPSVSGGQPAATVNPRKEAMMASFQQAMEAVPPSAMPPGPPAPPAAAGSPIPGAPAAPPAAAPPPPVPPSRPGMDAFQGAMEQEAGPDAMGGMSAPAAAPKKTFADRLFTPENLLQFGLRMMAASQPQPGAKVGPSLLGAVGSAGLGTIEDMRGRESKAAAGQLERDKLDVRREEVDARNKALVINAQTKQLLTRIDQENKRLDRQLKIMDLRQSTLQAVAEVRNDYAERRQAIIMEGLDPDQEKAAVDQLHQEEKDVVAEMLTAGGVRASGSERAGPPTGKPEKTMTRGGKTYEMHGGKWYVR